MTSSSSNSSSEIVRGSTIVLNYPDKKQIDFFFFGCWNRIACDDGSDLQSVVNRIKVSSKRFDFGIIAGDNVYPDKSKDSGQKVKSFPPDRLDKGIECVSQLGYDLYACLGNHDVQDCVVLADMNKYKHLGKWHVGSYYVMECKLADSLVVFIVIDTNLFELDRTCYTETMDVGAERESMLKWLKYQLNLYSKRASTVVVVGHEPLFGYKLKKGSFIATYYQTFGPVIDLLFKYKKTYYLCADIHNYQHLSLIDDRTGNEIDVIVSGTGGASPDETFRAGSAESAAFASFHPKDSSFSVKLHDIQDAFGYCDVTAGDGLNGRYVQVIRSQGCVIM